MAQMLTAKQVAEVKGCSYRYIKRIIQEGKLKAIETVNEKNRKTYLVPLDELEPDLQIKWYEMQAESLPDGSQMNPEPEPEKAEVDQFSEEDRREIDFWIELIQRWREYRAMPGVISLAEVDQKFVTLCRLEHPERNISIDILYRKWRAVKEDNLKGLIDQRGKWRKEKSDMDELVWEAFLYFYLSQNRHPVSKCREYTKLWAREKHPELYDQIPSHSAFRRRLKWELSECTRILAREGEKAFDDKYSPFIQREYLHMQSNEYWIADNHTFDVIVVDKDGKQHRPYLTAFMDARSGIFVGYYITYNPSSQATLYALRRAIKKYGIPIHIYVDNGREFLTLDVGGLGHRKKKKKKQEGVELVEPPGVFKRLGIQMTNALVCNGKAKTIERRFRDVKDHLSRLFDTYTGGNVLEKPERLKKVLKSGEIYTDEEFKEIIETLIEGYFNQQPYDGQVTSDRGKSRMQVYNERLGKVRYAKEEDLYLMMLRTTRPHKVGRLGVTVPIAGAKLQYMNDDLLQMQGKSVYVRYDPDDLSVVRVYDLEDRFLMEVEQDSKTRMKYGADSDSVREGIRTTRSFKKAQKTLIEGMILPEKDRIPAIDLVMSEAQRNIAEGLNRAAEAKVIEIHRAGEGEKAPLLRKVSGSLDLDTMIKSAAKRKEKS